MIIRIFFLETKYKEKICLTHKMKRFERFPIISIVSRVSISFTIIIVIIAALIHCAHHIKFRDLIYSHALHVSNCQQQEHCLHKN